MRPSEGLDRIPERQRETEERSRFGMEQGTITIGVHIRVVIRKRTDHFIW